MSHLSNNDLIEQLESLKLIKATEDNRKVIYLRRDIECELIKRSISRPNLGK